MTVYSSNEVQPPKSHPQGLLSHNVLPTDNKTITTETMVELDEQDAASSLDAPCVAVIIGCNAPTRKSILITPTRNSPCAPLPDPQPPSTTSSCSTTSSAYLPVPIEGTEDATPDTTRESSLVSFREEDTACTPQLVAQRTDVEHEAQRLNIKFAPLPDVGPRKRRGMPLGVAARSRMVRRRRSRAGENGVTPQLVSTPMWTEEEMEEQRHRLAKAWEEDRERRDYHGEVDGCGEPIEDPITALGRLFKVTKKRLWHKIVNREGKEKREPAKDQTGTCEGNEEKDRQASMENELPDCEDRVKFPREEQAPDADKGQEGNGDCSWEEIGRRQVSQEQPGNDTITRKRSLWGRTQSLSRKKNLSPSSEAESSAGGDIPSRSPHRREGNIGKRASLRLAGTLNKENSKARLRSLSA